MLRDSRSLLGSFWLMPLMLMSVLGYGVNLDSKYIKVFALDQEGSQASQDLLKRFQSSEYFDLAATVTDYRALASALDDGRCQLAIVIPRTTSQGASARRASSEHPSAGRWLRQQHR